MEDKKDQLVYLRANIKKLKKEKKLTNESLAQLSGLSIDTIKSISKNNGRFPSIPTLDKLASAFGVTKEVLLSGTYDQMLTDQRLAELAINEAALQDAVKVAPPQKQFEALLVEEGFDDITAFVNYLMFLGYEIVFKSKNKGNLYSSKSDTRKHDLYEEKKKLTAYSKEIKEQISRIEATINKKEEELARLSQEDKKYGDIQMNIDNMNYKLDALYSSITNNEGITDNILSQIETGSFTYTLGMEEVVQTFKKITSLPEKKFQSELKVMPLMVQISNKYKKCDKELSFYDFYNLCDSFNSHIEEMLK